RHHVADHRAGRGAGLAGRLDVRRDRGRVAVDGALADALRVDELALELAPPERRDRLADERHRVLLAEEAHEDALLQPARDRRPVAPDRLEADDDEASVDPAGVALLAAADAAPDPRHEEPLEDVLELERELGLDAVALAHALDDPALDALPQRLGLRARRLARLLPRQLDEHRIRVAVHDGEALVLERLARPREDLLPEAGDRVGDRGVEEAARRRSQDAEERIHHDLDRLVGVAIAARLRGLAARHEAIDHPGQDRGVAREARAVRRLDRVDVRAACAGVRERVELEGPDEARVEALEVEDGDGPQQAGHGMQE